MPLSHQFSEIEQRYFTTLDSIPTHKTQSESTPTGQLERRFAQNRLPPSYKPVDDVLQDLLLP